MNNDDCNSSHEKDVKFELDEQDREVITIVTRFTESILEKMPSLKTRQRVNQAVGLGRALRYLARLPDVTSGVSLKYGVSLSGLDSSVSPISAKRYWGVEIDEKSLVVQAGTSRHNNQKYSDAISANDIPDFYYETLNFHYEIRIDGHRNSDGSISDWEDEIEDALNGSFTIFVVDQCNEKLLSDIHNPAQIIKYLENLGAINADESNKALRNIQTRT